MSSKINYQNSVNTSQSTANVASLETEYGDLIFSHKSVWWKKPGFQDYLEPNESPPQRVKPHLTQSEVGVVVSTGTERSLFDLLFSNEEMCQGVIVRDVNPKIKAYVDFNVLLLRISQNLEEYVQLSAPIPWWSDNQTVSLANRFALITEKTRNSDLPERVKNYYLEHMEDFGGVYLAHLRGGESWREDRAYSECWYHKNEAQFLKLQRYAKAGNIIATVGNINDLNFLKNRKINIVDTSNIHEYCVVNLQGEGDFSPHVIWTELASTGGTRYYSASYVPHASLTEEEEAEFQKWLTLFKHDEFKSIVDGAGGHYFQVLSARLMLDPSILRNNPKEILNKLRKYINDHVIHNPLFRVVQDPILGNICLSNPNQITNLTLDEIKLLCRNPQTQQHLPFLVGQIGDLTADRYVAFMSIEGWKEEFEKQCLNLQLNLTHVLNKLDRENVLASFEQKFGRTRLETLKRKYTLARQWSNTCQRVKGIWQSISIIAKVGIASVGMALVGSYFAMSQSSDTPRP